MATDIFADYLDPRPWIGLSFRDHGRERPFLDCWGLVRLVYAECLAVELPAYDTISAFDVRAVGAEVSARLPEWTGVPRDRHRAFDVVVCTEGGIPCHVGMAVGREHMLHIRPGGTSLAEHLDGPRLRHVPKSFHRHRALVGRMNGVARAAA